MNNPDFHLAQAVEMIGSKEQTSHTLDKMYSIKKLLAQFPDFKDWNLYTLYEFLETYIYE